MPSLRGSCVGVWHHPRFRRSSTRNYAQVARKSDVEEHTDDNADASAGPSHTTDESRTGGAPLNHAQRRKGKARANTFFDTYRFPTDKNGTPDPFKVMNLERSCSCQEVKEQCEPDLSSRAPSLIYASQTTAWPCYSTQTRLTLPRLLPTLRPYIAPTPFSLLRTRGIYLNTSAKAGHLVVLQIQPSTHSEQRRCFEVELPQRHGGAIIV